jgi:hypothetical protein
VRIVGRYCGGFKLAQMPVCANFSQIKAAEGDPGHLSRGVAALYAHHILAGLARVLAGTGRNAFANFPVWGMLEKCAELMAGG